MKRDTCLVPTLQRRGFYRLLPYNEGLIDLTASYLELSRFLVEYATLFHPTTAKFSTLPYPELRLIIDTGVLKREKYCSLKTMRPTQDALVSTSLASSPKP